MAKERLKIVEDNMHKNSKLTTGGALSSPARHSAQRGCRG